MVDIRSRLTFRNKKPSFIIVGWRQAVDQRSNGRQESFLEGEGKGKSTDGFAVDQILGLVTDGRREEKEWADREMPIDGIVDADAQFVIVPVAVIAHGVIVFLIVADQRPDTQ